MEREARDEPLYRGIMLSSTFRDLKQHRKRAMTVVNRTDYKAIGMENDGALTVDVLESSLSMVRKSSAYVCVIGLRYGEVLKDPILNPEHRSLTELEFEEAERLDLPILLYVMADEHPTTRADHVSDAELAARNYFAKRASRIKGQEPQRVYYSFVSEDDFAQRLAEDLGKLSRTLAPQTGAKDLNPKSNGSSTSSNCYPAPPERAASPRYLGSHNFVGRREELEKLDDWTDAADHDPLYVLAAIGGSGKSYLTWHWMESHAVSIAETLGSPWTGRFWYSFYEAGATMLGFCRQALAYIEKQPRDAFDHMHAPEAEARLLDHLEKDRWLLVLDGLERVLVEYNRSDAAYMDDAEADEKGSLEPDRKPCETIKPADGAFLRRLSQAQPSRILITTRLVPTSLVNESGMHRPGVKVDFIRGLKGKDAEAMMRANRVFGDGRALRAYVKNNCDNHPLAIGVLAGLIANYPPRPGDFDAWVEDPDHGRALSLGDLDLKQRRNHILRAGLNALGPESRGLMGALSFLYEGGDYETLEAINPKRPAPPEVGEEPDQIPATAPYFIRRRIEKQREDFRAYKANLAKWKRDPTVKEANRWLQTAILDLRERGLLQYEESSNRYNLHPVIRSVVAFDQIGTEHDQEVGQRVVDHFTSVQHPPFKDAVTLADLTVGLELVRAFTRLKRFDDAIRVLQGELTRALIYNLAALDDLRALLRPFFPNGWEEDPVELSESYLGYLLNEAAIALYHSGSAEFLIVKCLKLCVAEERHSNTCNALVNLAWAARRANRLIDADRFLKLAARLCTNEDDRKYVNLYQLIIDITLHRPNIFEYSANVASFEQGETRHRFRKSTALVWRAEVLRRAGHLTVDAIDEAEDWAKKLKDRSTHETALMLRAQHAYETEGPAESLHAFEATTAMCRERGETNHTLEAEYLRARQLAGENVEHEDALRLDNAPDRSALALAELWEALGDIDISARWAIRALNWAVADGEPYVRRFELERAQALLTRLGKPVPEVPTCNLSDHRPYPWEAEVERFAGSLEGRLADEEALRQAVRDRDLPTVRALVKKGVSPFAGGEDGKDALDLARKLKEKDDPLAEDLFAALRDGPDKLEI